MPTMTPDRAHDVRELPRAARTPATALFWRLFGFNTLVFGVGALVLVLSPATVSTPVVLTEVAVLAIGSALLLMVNAVLLRATLRPLDGLSALMERVDLLRPGSAQRGTPGAHLQRHAGPPGT
jgi:two-component system sensor histidine kinase UhpB